MDIPNRIDDSNMRFHLLAYIQTGEITMAQPVDSLYSVREAARITGYSEYYIRLKLERNSIQYATIGTCSRGGGRKYRASDLRKALGDRFKPTGEKDGPDTRCPRCGDLADGFGRTKGLCMECWCKVLNKYLIGQRMHLEDAIKAAETEINQTENNNG